MAQVMEGQAHDPGFLHGFRVAGPHAVVGVPTGPAAISAAITGRVAE